MPLCEYTVMRCGSQVSVSAGRAGVAQLAVPSGWAELAVGASRPVGPSHGGRLVVQRERDGIARADRLVEALMRGAKGAFSYCDAAGSRSSCAVMHGIQMAV